MKYRILLFLLSAILLLPLLASCGGERHDLLYSTEVDGVTYCVRGSGTRAKQLVIKQGDALLWTTTVRVDRKVGSLRGTYGLQVLDLNFDGHLDVMIVDGVAGDCRSYLCWLKDPESGDYVASKALTGLCNIQTDEKLKAVFAFTHSFQQDKEYADVQAATITTDTTTKYLWTEDGALVPETRASITFYSETNLYCYSVSYYNEAEKDFDDSNDKWLTPEEYAACDMSFLYYFK
ncbi:MAG: hypothetical protein IJX28_04595 [Clostridia bacterium]|nr:hypothetical protein [Clostridia bacterium]